MVRMPIHWQSLDPAPNQPSPTIKGSNTSKANFLTQLLNFCQGQANRSARVRHPYGSPPVSRKARSPKFLEFFLV